MTEGEPPPSAALKQGCFGCTCFGEVSQGAAEGAPLQALSHGVGVVQTGAVHAPVAGFLLQAGALRHAGPHHPLLLLQLSCGKGRSQGNAEVSDSGFCISLHNLSVMSSATFRCLKLMNVHYSSA